jgi:hypothetical protein
MSDQPEEPAPQDPPLQGTVRDDSALPAETLTEVSVTETKATVKQVMVAPESPAASPSQRVTAVQLALSAGWTMAVLYGNIPATTSGRGKLPAVYELPKEQRAVVELVRLRHLLTSLERVSGSAGSSAPAEVPGYAPAELEALNLAILEVLATAPPEVEMAYRLGRSLRDTVNPPLATEEAGKAKDQDPLAKALERGRVAKLQEWLATLSTQFSSHTAAIVAASLGRWSEFAAVTIGKKRRLRTHSANPTVQEIRDHLLPQGDLWLMLLTGERTTNGLLSPEGYVAAGEAALRRSARIMRQILKHHAAVWIILAGALAGLLYLSLRYLAGSAKVWTSIATVGGTLGAAGRTITNTVGRLTAEAERPIFAMAEEDAMAWAITTLPAAKLTPRGVRMLRKAGIAPSSELGRV